MDLREEDALSGSEVSNFIRPVERDKSVISEGPWTPSG